MILLFFKGFLLSFSLIAAIGAQNAFIIKQGISQNHIFIVSGICFLCDVVLMGFGVFGIGEFFAKNPVINLTIAILGILFILYYGFLSLKSAFLSQSSFEISQGNKLSLKKTILLTLAVTLLNPHVYLDTVFVIGAAVLMFSFDEKIIFASGALVASFLWFFGLGYGALKLSQILIKMTKTIDILIAIIMFFIAFSLIRYVSLSSSIKLPIV
ncbi:LysE/ArgO family amino acid transporter [Helicobacter apodemus]|uniref:Lysine transporter LysE n=1 Tax=Helicobacter apodemus TaxID=135569 RepID=A0A2U8FEA8_9HELI|nr:LysE/ArgO family amino acid transporter [Helicobacter apodemus]AWI34118.1 lysine transporter LysE [Helicobacter apodemus]AWI34580.1 lysine transporter LysE [Helicobacter apodemus]